MILPKMFSPRAQLYLEHTRTPRCTQTDTNLMLPLTHSQIDRRPMHTHIHAHTPLKSHALAPSHFYTHTQTETSTQPLPAAATALITFKNLKTHLD